MRAKIADGGMASVFVGCAAASDSRGSGDGGGVNELVAIKMIRDEFSRNAEFEAMFMDEAKIVLRLHHDNVVRHHELGSDRGHLFIVMELLSGRSLWSLWEACRARKVRLPYATIAWIGARAADGLHHAHEVVDEDGRSLEIVHRDVNATNIFVTDAGEIKIIDFGLAKAANRASKTAAGIIKGKIGYLSPEQVVGAPVDRRTDVFALGTTLWELACDRRLFKSPDDAETLRRVHAALVPDPRTIAADFPPELARVLGRALARDPGDRFATAHDLSVALDAFARRAADRSGEPADAASLAAFVKRLVDSAPEEVDTARAPTAPAVRRPWTRGASVLVGLVACLAAALLVLVSALLHVHG